MALPKSTFVMGVVTLGLFGVAIYKTSTEKSDPEHFEDDDDEYEDDDELDEDDLEEYSRAEAERARRRVEEEAKEAEELLERKAALREAVGAEQAMPGPLFAGIELDGTSEAPAAANERIERFVEATTFVVELGEGKHERFEIRNGSRASYDDRDRLCAELHGLLGTAWGSAYIDDDGVELWTNKLTKTRAWFVQSASCRLVFERFDEPSAWLAKAGPSTVPLGWLGKPVKVAQDALGVTDTEGEIEWTGHGLGAGKEPTTLTARLAQGKITQVAARTFVSSPARTNLEDHLRAEFGKPKIDETPSGDVRWQWPNRQLRVVFADNGAVDVTIGAP